MSVSNVPVLKAKARGGKKRHKLAVLRESGGVPAHIYGHGKANVEIELDGREVEVHLRSRPNLVKIECEGKDEYAIIKEVQQDIYMQNILHVDFQRVALDELVHVNVQIEIFGTPVGLEHGGKYDLLRTTIPIVVKAMEIPSRVSIIISNLDVGDSIKFKDVALPASAKLEGNPNLDVCRISVPKKVVEVAPVAAVEGAAAEGAAAPEADAEGGAKGASSKTAPAKSGAPREEGKKEGKKKDEGKK